MKEKIWVKLTVLVLVGVSLEPWDATKIPSTAVLMDASVDSAEPVADAVVVASKEICMPCTDTSECVGDDAICLELEGLGAICTTQCVLS